MPDRRPPFVESREPVSFHQWTIDPDPIGTAVESAARTVIDPACCPACSSYLDAVQTHRVPAAMVKLLAAVGADPEKPVVVAGSDDGLLIGGWYEFAGRLLAGPAADTGTEESLARPQSGWTCSISVAPDRGMGRRPLLRLQFAWQLNDMIGYDRVIWPGQS